MDVYTSAFVLGDQLSPDISSLRDVRKVVMVESAHKCGSGKEHKRRIAFVISAMRHFRDELERRGFDVDYYEWSPDFISALHEHVRRERIRKLYVMRPKNRPGIRLIESLGRRPGIDVVVTENNQFMCSDTEFSRWLEGRKLPRLEHFYRMMRKTRDVLMEGKEPAGGQWTFDRENRKPLPADVNLPVLPEVEDDALTGRVVDEVRHMFPDNFGELDRLGVPVDRDGALVWEQNFIEHILAEYGRFEFAMRSGLPVLGRSRASSFMNAGLLSPQECVAMAESAYDEGRVPVNSAEGYIKGIMGWREYMAGMYTASSGMLEYNYFENHRKLPAFFMDESLTMMNCVKHSVKAARETAYNNHSQRLMVLGNFALLAGIEPKAFYGWCMKAYEDACEWAAMPNAICLSQYADGGKVAMKPYVSTAAFINTMSDYCRACHYSPYEKTSENACPFNFLYWHFMAGEKTYHIKNCRLTIPHRTLERADPDVRNALEEKSRAFLDSTYMPLKLRK